MYKELNQHKKSDAVKWVVVFILLIVLIAGVASFLAISISNMSKDTQQEEPVEQLEDGSLVVKESEKPSETIYEMPAKLMFGTFSNPLSMATAGHTASITLSATVTPVEADNRLVDWSIEWGIANTHGEEAVTDYVTVTPKSDGSNIATVTCKKAFGDDEIYVKVTTRDGGFIATCKVIYIGNPTSLTIAATGASVKNDTNWGISVAEVNSQNTYLFDLNLDNEFGLVGSSFTPNYSVSCEAVGSIKIKNDVYDASGTHLNTVYEVAEMGISDNRAHIQVGNSQVNVGKYSIEGNKLKVEALSVPSSAFSIMAGPTGRAERRFDSYPEGKQPYVTVTVTEQNTGITAKINVRTTSAVTNVTLSNSTIGF